MSKRFRNNLIIVILGLAIVFVLQNAAPVTTTLFFISFEMPRAVLIALTFLAGGFVGYLATLSGFLPNRKGSRPE